MVAVPGGSNRPGEKEAPKNVVVKDFDLDSHIANYSGHAKIFRLIFIAERCSDLAPEAARMALEEIQKTSNTTLYKDVCEKFAKLGSGTMDLSWCEAVDKKAQGQMERLELELNGYRTNLIKESIRIGHNDLGDFHYDRGDLNAALKCYVRTRDYCTTSKHIIAMCLNVIKVSIEMGNFPHVANYVNKAESTPELSDPAVKALLKACAGLAYLEGRKYRMAALKFLETTFDISGRFTDLVAAQDVAIYGGLSALATFERTDLKKKVIDNAQFKNFLELVPRVRDCIHDFYQSKYASCLNYLEELKPELQLDLHLHDHVNSLYAKIRSKALVQYFSPFISVDMNKMAEAFNTTIVGLEQELGSLIVEGSINARIDSHNKVLYARKTNLRSSTFDTSIKMGETYQRNTKAMILRMNILKRDFIIRPPRKEEGPSGSHSKDK